MKNFLTALVGCILGSLLTLGGVYTYEKTAGPIGVEPESIYQYADSVVYQVVANYNNPSMETVDEVVLLQDFMAGELADATIFTSMPPEVLKNVATVCIERNGSTSKSSIVTEYTSNKDIYDNLPNTKNKIAHEVDTTGTDLGSRSKHDKIISTSYKYRTDTINGKPVKIMVRTEESVE